MRLQNLANGLSQSRHDIGGAAKSRDTEALRILVPQKIRVFAKIRDQYGVPGNLGDVDVLTFGYRYYPFISSRAGFAFHNEYSISRQRGSSVISGADVTSSSLFLGFDFIF